MLKPFISCYPELTEGSIPMAIAISLYFSSQGCMPTQEGKITDTIKWLVTKEWEQSLIQLSWKKKHLPNALE